MSLNWSASASSSSPVSIEMRCSRSPLPIRAAPARSAWIGTTILRASNMPASAASPSAASSTRTVRCRFRVERGVGLLDRQLDEHHPVERRNRRVRGQHARIPQVLRDLLVLRLRRAGQRGRARRLHLREARQIDVAQHQAEIGMRDQAPHGVDDVGLAALADLDLRHHIPDELEIDLGDAHAVVATHAGHRDGHVGLGVAAEIDRAVIDLVRLGLDELRLLGKIGAAADDVQRRARHADLLPAGRIELGELGDGRHLPQQAQRVDPPLLQRARRSTAAAWSSRAAPRSP